MKDGKDSVKIYGFPQSFGPQLNGSLIDESETNQLPFGIEYHRITLGLIG